MRDLPQAWSLVALQEVCDVIRGITFPATVKEVSKTTGNVGCLRTANIQKEIDWDDVYFVARDYVKRQDQLVRPGDLLMSMANSYELVGKVAVARRVPFEAAFGAFLGAVRPTPAVGAQYLFHFLRTRFAQDALREGSSQTTNIANISVGRLGELLVPVAPRPEQQRIADKLDALLARVEACSERLDRLPVLTMRFRQSVLSAAMNGELTADWREAAVRAMDWEESTIGSVATDLRYGTAKKCDYRETGTPVLRIPNIGEHGRLKLGDMKRCDFEDFEVERLALHPGDLLVIRSNGSIELVGKTGLVDRGAAGMLFAGYLMRLRVDPDLAIPKYVQLSLASPEVRRRIELTSKSTSGVNNLNAEELRGMPLSLPLLDEQAEIVRRVGSLFALADAIEAKCKTARAQVERLTPAILANAFRGELVPQDPNDEPASALLARVEAERAAAPARKTRARKAAGGAA